MKPTQPSFAFENDLLLFQKQQIHFAIRKLLKKNLTFKFSVKIFKKLNPNISIRY